MNRGRLFRIQFLFVGMVCTAVAMGADLLDASPLTDRIVLLHYSEGRVEYHKRGQKRSDDKVFVSPLDLDVATNPRSYRVTGSGQNLQPTRVGRKTKGMEFAWFADQWIDNRAVNTRPDHVKQHWLYLSLPEAMQAGKTYTLTIAGKPAKTMLFDPAKTRSEAVYVNLIGYAPNAPKKFGYVYQWAGDMGGLDLKAYVGKRFRVLATNGKSALEGKLAFRRPANQIETFHTTDTPNQNFLNADVYECDFSALKTPGRYTLAVDGIGASFPFEVKPDIYREPFVVAARGLYHNRSGIALTKPYTEYERPAPHNPVQTPAFKGKLFYTSVRYQEWGSEGGYADALKANFKGPLEAWGWYQDAGDWDSYVSHLRVPQELLFAFEIAPRNFKDGELNIPESKNGIPDILDEALWLPRFCHRLRQELLAKKYGTGGIGLRIAGDAFGGDTGPNDVGRGSWEDDRVWAASGEDAVSTMGYASVAAQAAIALKRLGKPDSEGVDWSQEARSSYAWAMSHTQPGDDIKRHRASAAAALFRLTGEKAFEDQFAKDMADVNDETLVKGEDIVPLGVYLLGSSQSPRNPELAAKLRAALVRAAEYEGIRSADERALRWGGDIYFPMLIGQQTTPIVMATALAWGVTGDQRYLSVLYTTADYFLGTNPLGQTWVTGLGPRFPQHVFHLDAWYNGKPTVHPGLVPYGPWRKAKELGQGPWDHDWPNSTVYPKIDFWPGAERWFNNRTSPMSAEFTVHQNIAPTAAIFGILRAPGRG